MSSPMPHRASNTRAVTPIYGWPTPGYNDAADGPYSYDTLAIAIENTLRGIEQTTTQRLSALPTRMAAGTTDINVRGTAVTKYVTFTTPFKSYPAMAANIGGGAGTTAQWDVRAISIGIGGFTVFAFGPNNTFTVGITWTASERTQPTTLARDTTPVLEEGWQTATASCHTSRCPSNGRHVPGVIVPIDASHQGWAGVECGACQQPITDIVTEGSQS